MLWLQEADWFCVDYMLGHTALEQVAWMAAKRWSVDSSWLAWICRHHNQRSQVASLLLTFPQSNWGTGVDAPRQHVLCVLYGTSTTSNISHLWQGNQTVFLRACVLVNVCPRWKAFSHLTHILLGHLAPPQGETFHISDQVLHASRGFPRRACLFVNLPAFGSQRWTAMPFVSCNSILGSPQKPHWYSDWNLKSIAGWITSY